MNALMQLLMPQAQADEKGTQLDAFTKLLNAPKKQTVKAPSGPPLKKKKEAAAKPYEPTNMPTKNLLDMDLSPYGQNVDLNKVLKERGVMDDLDRRQAVYEATNIAKDLTPTMESDVERNLSAMTSDLMSQYQNSLNKRTSGLDLEEADQALSMLTGTKKRGWKNSSQAKDLMNALNTSLMNQRLLAASKGARAQSALSAAVFPMLTTSVSATNNLKKTQPTSLKPESINASQLNNASDLYASSRTVYEGSKQAKDLIEKMNKSSDSRDFLRLAGELKTLTATLDPHMRKLVGTGANLTEEEIINIRNLIPGSIMGLDYDSIINKSMPISLLKSKFGLSDLDAMYKRVNDTNKAAVEKSRIQMNAFNRPAAKKAAQEQLQVIDKSINTQFGGSEGSSRDVRLNRYGMP